MKYLLPFASTGVGEYKKKPCISLIYKVFWDFISSLLVLSSDPESGKRDSHSRCARAVPRNFADTPGPWKGRFEVAGAESIAPACPACKTKGRIFEDSPFCFGAENGFPTQAYSSFTISALHEAFSSKVTPAMRSSCTRLHPNAFDKDNEKLHLIQVKMGMVLFF